MEELPLLNKEIADLTTLLSLLFKRPPNIGERVDTLQRSNSDISPDPTFFKDNEVEADWGTAYVEETEFEDEGASGRAAVDALKRKALDRLAEALARFKTAKDPRARRNGNRDAQHVASVVMVEDFDNCGVKIFCSKNEGLDDVDETFLRSLKGLLEMTSNNVERQPDSLDLAFELIFDQQRPRVEFYSSILQDAFARVANIPSPNTLTRDVLLEHQGMRPISKREWKDNNGLQFEFRYRPMDEASVSDMAVDCLSNQEEETTVADAFREIESLFNSPAFDPSRSSRTKTLLKRLYSIIQHPRQRPALKGLLRQALHGYEQSFRKAWNALLFLARIYCSAETVVQLASNSKTFKTVNFFLVPKEFRLASKANPDKRTPLEVLTALGCCPQTEAWTRFFRDKVEEYMQLSQLRRTVHAEVQLICYLGTSPDLPEGFTGEIFPYIGCSRKCCFFCEELRVVHGTFAARGTHEAVFPRWALPQALAAREDSDQPVRLMRQFSIFLKKLLRTLLSMPYPSPHRDLIQQSTAALSTAQAVRRETPSYSERPSIVTKMAFPLAVSAFDGQVQFTPSPQKPGYASFLAPSMHNDGGRILPIEEAETFKINHDRGTCSLEKMDQMPPMRDRHLKRCRRCKGPAKCRCSACRTWYCSRICQRRNWSAHVFTCRTLNRPNDVDYLRLIVKRVKKEMVSENPENIHNSLLELFADDHICRTFGFNNCSSWMEAVYLVCLYDTIISRCRSPVKLLQASLEAGDLASLLELCCHQFIEQMGGQSECSCISWFLARQATEPLTIPDPDKETYELWVAAFAETIESLKLTNRIVDGRRFNAQETEVFELFITIQPSIWRLPDICSSAWINFGFCYCKSFSQRQELADKYLALASSNATFDDIVSAYKASTMAELMATHGIDLSNLERNGIKLHMPTPCQYAVFRLMIGVEHALSGRYCNCFRMREGRSCHQYFETHLDSESDVSYGFHLASSWERWRLLTFYAGLFKLPGFDPGAMGKAKESGQRGSLEKYLDTLVPDTRRKLFDRNRAEYIGFPNLDGRLSASTVDGERIAHYHLPCNCKVHNVVGPPGICHLKMDQIVDCGTFCSGS